MYQTHMENVRFVNRNVSLVENGKSLTINVGREWWPYEDPKEAQDVAALLIELSEEALDLNDLRWLGFAILKRVNNIKERSDDDF